MNLGAYAWLGAEPAPRMLVEALKLYGVTETAGGGDNPEILSWARECGAPGYAHDETPWCGLFIGVVAKRAGKPVPENPLWARNWAAWGDPSPHELGAVLVFSRNGGGHVGLYVGEDPECFHVLGGNQGDKVCVTRIAKRRLLACRAVYRTQKPASVRAIHLAPQGALSTNER